MIIIRKRLWGIGKAVIWFASGEFAPESYRSPIIYFRQHSLTIPKQYVVHSEPFHTLMLDLTLEPDQLHQRVSKSCRYEISRATKEGVTVTKLATEEEIARFLQEHARFNHLKGLGRSLDHAQLSAHPWTLYQASRNNEWLSFLLLTEDDERVRMWVFFNNLSNPNSALLGYASRHLLWYAIVDAQSRGMKAFDFGGIVLDKDDPRYGITRYKLAFGGIPIDEHNTLVIPNLILRIIYKAGLSLRSWYVNWKQHAI